MDGEAGKATLQELENRHGKLPDTPTQRTPGGDLHLFFRSWGQCKNRAGVLDKEGFQGLDVRGDGGQVVAAPSIHPKTGNAYSWVNGRDLKDVAIADCPSWLRTIIEGNKPQAQDKTPAASTGGVIAGGARNQTMASWAGTMRKRGMAEAAIEAALLETNKMQCRPPLPESEVRTVARSIGNKPAGDVEKKSKNSVAVQSMSGNELMTTTFPDVRWAVEGVIPDGCSILAGPPKVGKSIFALNIALAVAVGGLALGKIELERGDVLYLALEDTWRRLQSRIKESGISETADLSSLTLVRDIPRQHDGGLAYVEDWLARHKDVRLAVIMTRWRRLSRQPTSTGWRCCLSIIPVRPRMRLIGYRTSQEPSGSAAQQIR